MTFRDRTVIWPAIPGAAILLAASGGDLRVHQPPGPHEPGTVAPIHHEVPGDPPAPVAPSPR